MGLAYYHLSAVEIQETLYGSCCLILVRGPSNILRTTEFDPQVEQKST